MAEFVGEATHKVRVRKRSFHYASVPQRHMDIDVRGYAALLDTTNVKQDNVMVHKSVGAITVKPLMANRDNYIFESNKPDKKYLVPVPNGAPPETDNEIKKRVFKSYPNEYQIHKMKNGSFFKRGGYTEVGSVSTAGDLDESPRFRDQDLPPIFSVDEGVEYPVASWIFQEKASGNVEWFLMQEYGNFANEPFWIDLYKFEKQEPSGPKGTGEDWRYTPYGDDRPLHAYFAIRIGWTASEEIKRMNGDGLLRVRNFDNARIGPYDVIFPIDGTPFIYDHQGEGIEDNEADNSFQYRDGFVPSEAPDQSWVITDDMEKVRLSFWVLRGKLIITSTHTDVPWVFPVNISPQTSADTKSRYENFAIPPGKICFFGRGFAWRMSYNPMEFNIYTSNEDKESIYGYHGRISFLPVPERTNFPGGRTGGWRDYIQGRETYFIDSGKEGFHNFTILPDDRFRDPLNRSNTEVLRYHFGWDVVTQPYYGMVASAAGDVTSMMIPITNIDNPFEPKIGLSGNRPRDLVNAFFDTPANNSDIAAVDTGGDAYGFDVTLKDVRMETKARIPVVELSCRAPEFQFGDISYTDGISRRFASPVFWALKGVHLTPEPAKTEWIDISRTVENISYQITCNDLQSYEQSFNITVIIPKDYQYGDFGIGTNENTYTDSSQRNEFIKLFQSGVLEIEVWLGWLSSDDTSEPALNSAEPFSVFRTEDFEDVRINGRTTVVGGQSQVTGGHTGKRVRVFTGLAYPGQLEQTFAKDTINLKCKDFLSLLNDQIIINSPMFDGMATDNAFYEVGMLGGLPRSFFDVRSAAAHWHILPMAFTFQNPKIRFEENSSILDAIRQIAQYFMHIVRSDPDGRVVLGDIYYSPQDIENEGYLGATKRITELPLTHESYNFFVDGGFGSAFGEGGPPNPWQRCYETFNFEKTIEDQLTQLLIMTVDRNDGALIMDNRAVDVPAIEDPDADNFIGYSKIGRYNQPALGDEKHLELFKRAFARRVFTAPMKISFTTYGRPTMRALDIIGVYHTHDLNLNIETGGPANYLKYRVTEVKGSLQWDDGKYQFRTDITAEHL